MFKTTKNSLEQQQQQPSQQGLKTLTSLGALHRAYLSESETPINIVDDYIRELRNENKKINAVSDWFDEQTILKKAQESTERYAQKKPKSIWDGVPIVIKDDIANTVGGRRIGNGSHIWKTNQLMPIPKRSTNPIECLLEGGAIPICRSTVPELCYKGTTSSYTNGITRNPHDLDFTSGGSSGGSAAIIGANIGWFAFGSDGGGSIRIPAAICGCVGFKPSYGLNLPRDGCKAPYLATVGPITKNVSDVTIYMDFIVHNTKAQIPPWISNLSKEDLNIDFSLSNLTKPIDDLKIGVAQNFSGLIDYINPIIWQKTLLGIHLLKSMGCDVQFDEPKLNSISANYIDVFWDIWKVYCAYAYGTFVNSKNSNFVDPGLLQIIQQGKQISARRVLAGEQHRDSIRQIIDDYFDKYDVMITPTIPVLPSRAQSFDKDFRVIDQNDGLEKNIWEIYHPSAAYTALFNLTGHPAISIPCGWIETPNGRLPLGIQVVGKMFQDDLVLRVAHHLERRFNQIGSMSNNHNKSSKL